MRSMGHTFEVAMDQETVEGLLPTSLFDYFLLDIEIPYHHKGVPMIDCGGNVLILIKRTPVHQDRPVIAVTRHGLDSPTLAVSIMKKGAADYVCKWANGKWDLADKIREALVKFLPRELAHPYTGEGAGKREKFPGGTLKFFSDHVELEGYKIAGGEGETQARAFLNFLKQHYLAGERRAHGAREIAEALKYPYHTQSVAEAARQVRDICTRTIREKLGFDCEPDSVIANDGSGYQFAEKIKVEDYTQPAVPSSATLTATQKALLGVLGEGPASKKTLQRRLQLSAGDFEYTIVPLLACGRVKKSGTSTALRYKLARLAKTGSG